MPVIPPCSKGQRGRVAKSDAHNLHERLVKHEESVLRFLRDAHVRSTDDAGERAMRMPGSKSRSQAAFAQTYGEPHARISSYMQPMAALGYNPLVAIQIALAGQAADMVKQHDGPTLPEA